MQKLNKEEEILKVLFKDFLNNYNSRSISKIIGISHVGAYKILKRLEKREIAEAKKIGQSNIYRINFENPVAKKLVEIILTIESQNYKRWLEEFKDIGEKNLVILFGSIIKNPEKARDVDLLIVSEEKNFRKIKEKINKKNMLSIKKIHLLLQTANDFKKDIESRNKTIIEVIKNGIVLYGQEMLIRALEKEFKK